MRHRVLTLVVAGLIASPFCGVSGAEIRQIYLSEEPLLSEDTERGVEGLFADVFQRMADLLGREVMMRRLPWKRAQNLTENGAGTAIGPLTRTKSREGRFAWIAPLFPMRIVYVSVKDRSPVINDLDQARRARVVVKRGSTGTFAAKKHGLPEGNVDIVNFQTTAFNMLAKGRIDAWLTWDVIAHRARTMAGSGLPLAVGYTDVLGDLYLAASPNTEPDEVARWRHAAQQVIESGGLKDIMRIYLGAEIANGRH